MKYFTITAFALLAICGCQDKETKIESTKKESVAKPSMKQESAPKTESKPVAIQEEKVESTLSVGELWALYKAARAEGKKQESNLHFAQAATSFAKAATAAVQLEKPSIASWQYNSAGKNLIDAFSKSCNYKEAMQKLESMKYGEEKVAYRKETKSCFSQQWGVLENALSYLEKAESFDSQKEEKGRKALILRNKEFITFIDQFTHKI